MSFTEKHLRAEAPIVVAGRPVRRYYIDVDVDADGAGTDPIEQKAANEFPPGLRHLSRTPKPARAGYVADLAPHGRVSD